MHLWRLLSGQEPDDQLVQVTESEELAAAPHLPSESPRSNMP